MKVPRLMVRQVMQSEPITVRPDARVQPVISLMNQQRIGAVLVTSEDGTLQGIFTERDFVRHVATAVPGWREYYICDWMTSAPHTIAPQQDWEEAVAAMQQHRVRHLPVVENDRVVGIISSRSLMAHRAEHLDQRIGARTQELKQANDQLLARETEITHNLRAAGRLQTQLLLPHRPPDWPELNWAVHYAPLDHLGGDYYDVARPDPNQLGFLIADASGHSVAAAMVAIMTRFAFGEIAPTTTKPGEVLAFMNQSLQQLTDERFVTAFYGVLNRQSRVFRFANAGQPYPLWYQAATGEVKPVKARGFMLGIIPDEVYYEAEITLAPGDLLCFYTDGLVEAMNEIGEQFGDERLTACVRNHGMLTPQELCDQILNCQRGFCGDVLLTDDLTLAICKLV